MENKEVKLLPPGILAYIGDSVYELAARRHLIKTGYRNSHSIHQAAVELVRASAQATALRAIEPLLTEEEGSIVRRGRNSGSGNIPVSVDGADYRLSTGLEALFGYHYLCGNEERLSYLWEIVLKNLETDKNR